MLHPKLATDFVIVIFTVIIFVIIGIICISMYWMCKKKQNKGSTVSYDHDLEEVTIGEHDPNKNDDQYENNVDGHLEKPGLDSDDEYSSKSSELDESIYHELIEKKALKDGIDLNVLSCSSKKYKLCIAKSKQRGFKSQIGVFNRGNIIEKGIRFGPIEESDQDLVRLYRSAHNSVHKELEDGYNWLYFVQIAGEKTSTNMDVIFNEDGDCYYESRHDIPKGYELLSDFGWSATI